MRRAIPDLVPLKHAEFATLQMRLVKIGARVIETATRIRIAFASACPDKTLFVEVNAVRLQLHALAYNLANFVRTLATPEGIETWSLTSLRERLIKTGTRLVRHARYAVLQFAEAALPRSVFASVLGMINGLRAPPTAAAPI